MIHLKSTDSNLFSVNTEKVNKNLKSGFLEQNENNKKLSRPTSPNKASSYSRSRKEKRPTLPQPIQIPQKLKKRKKDKIKDNSTKNFGDYVRHEQEILNSLKSKNENFEQKFR